MRILVVEDHANTRKVMTRLLHRWGYEVTEANTMRSGLEHAQNELFDVILSDIALPDGTGYALISELRRCGQDVMAIALSGYNYPAEVEIAKLTGFDHHLTKPCDCQALRSLLEERIDRTSPFRKTDANGVASSPPKTLPANQGQTPGHGNGDRQLPRP